MKIGKKFHSMIRTLLGLSLCASIMMGLISCGPSPEQTGKNTPGSTTKPVGSTDGSGEYTPSGNPLDIVAGQKSDYTIVYPADCIAPTRSVYVSLKNQIRSAIGYSLDMEKDSDVQAGEYEILIGKTNRSESAEAMGKLQENQFSFTLSGKKIVIAASDDDCMKLAIQTFVERYAKGDKLTVYAGDFPITYACGENYKSVKVDNTANIEGDDPYVVEHDGYYYYCWSSGGVKVARLDSLAEINKDNGKQVFDKKDGGFEEVWAPELHYIDGSWYIYVSMRKGTENDVPYRRMYCLKGTTQDPTDPFELVGQVTDSTDKWAIDGTVFKYKDELYTVWSGLEDNANPQNLYIAHMSNPWTIDSERVRISTPTTWDNKVGGINEGPCVLVEGDSVRILYSGNGSWTDDYCVGYLTFTGSTGEDLLKAQCWEKSPNAFLVKLPKSYGPGHCSVVKADDGSYQIIYHANLESGTGWNGRSVRIQELIVTEDEIKLAKLIALETTVPIGEKYVIGPVDS